MNANRYFLSFVELIDGRVVFGFLLIWIFIIQAPFTVLSSRQAAIITQQGILSR